MGSIPAWQYQLVKLAISIGSPYLLDLIKKYISKLPAEILEIINDLIKSIKDPQIPTSNAKKTAAFKLKRCTGVACAPEVKKD